MAPIHPPCLSILGHYRQSSEMAWSIRATDAPVFLCVSKLFRAGIEVKPSYAESFLMVKFKKGVIRMPSITIDDVMSSFLVNCVAFEQSQPNISKYFMRSGIRWKWADFKREYCNKSWLLISALVALVYLLLTFGQTFIAIYAHVHPKT
ncbi:hypothetical protein CJ030_MR1G007510 [Morella rubra]|uniref:Uncharacterized protein n=1 Tax=Morella rubra TaxID=262757 RepID=A0A6A1WQ81_9ROSI|nr:hypothetical protein CJ030_MR1G007510 [Morella rubra]